MTCGGRGVVLDINYENLGTLEHQGNNIVPTIQLHPCCYHPTILWCVGRCFVEQQQKCLLVDNVSSSRAWCWQDTPNITNNYELACLCGGVGVGQWNIMSSLDCGVWGRLVWKGRFSSHKTVLHCTALCSVIRLLRRKKNHYKAVRIENHLKAISPFSV